MKSKLESTNLREEGVLAKRTAMAGKPKLGAYDEKLHGAQGERYEKKDAWVLPGAEDGWTRVFGQVMAMKRPDRCQRIRDGLKQLARDRVAATAPTRSWYARPISPERARPPATGADRPLPSMAVFQHSPIAKFPELPMCSMS